MLTLYTYDLEHRDPCDFYAPFHDQPHSIFFDGATKAHHKSQFSYVLPPPEDVYIIKKNALICRSKIKPISNATDLYSALNDIYHDLQITWGADDTDIPFTGGLAGILHYDLLDILEPIERRETYPHDPVLGSFGIYKTLIVCDIKKKRATLCTWSKNESDALEIFAHIKSSIENHTSSPKEIERATWQAQKGKEQYLYDLQKTINYIYAGDIFQANIAQHFTATLPEEHPPFAHYKHLRSNNAAPYSAYYNAGDYILCTTSPEEFITSDNGHVITSPIKGTAPIHDPAQKLEASEKDRAENIMIVDLLRNDLSKSCTPESIAVTKLCAIESFENLHHMVSTIEGTLSNDRTPIDLLLNAFPGGSITGAPKIRATEIIEELEPMPRHAYCGSLFMLSPHGYLSSNILIRSIIYHKHKDHWQTHLGAGGGITSASSPQAEYDETLLKASKLFESFKEGTES